MDEAIERAANHVGPGGDIEVTAGGNYQFRITTTDAAGNTESRMGRLDVNPNDPHVQRNGPHVNIETHRTGQRPINIHIPIRPGSIRPGDIP